MNYTKEYKFPIGTICLKSDGTFLTGLWFKNSCDEKKHKCVFQEKTLPIFEETKRWLDVYCSKQNPNFTPIVKLENLTPFRELVLNQIKKIPFGKTTTYGEIAKTIALKKGIKRMSAQAVGNATGWNPACIIIPCHRVVGVNNQLVGYGGGIENKIKLLKLEHVLD